MGDELLVKKDASAVCSNDVFEAVHKLGEKHDPAMLIAALVGVAATSLGRYFAMGEITAEAAEESTKHFANSFNMVTMEAYTQGMSELKDLEDAGELG